MSDRVKYPEEHESCDDPRDELPDQAEQTAGNEIHDGLKVTDDGESFYSQHSLTWALRWVSKYSQTSTIGPSVYLAFRPARSSPDKT